MTLAFVLLAAITVALIAAVVVWIVLDTHQGANPVGPDETYFEQIGTESRGEDVPVRWLRLVDRQRQRVAARIGRRSRP